MSILKLRDPDLPVIREIQSMGGVLEVGFDEDLIVRRVLDQENPQGLA